MPHVHQRQFRIRNYECDSYGHLNNANYLRFMQETAFDASTAVGYDFKKYQELGHSWLIRSSEIEYISPVVYDDTLEIKTWVADLRRVSSRRVYEFYNKANQSLIARAHTDWVYIDMKTLQPTVIPDEMKLAFFPEGLPDTFPSRVPIQPAPPPPPGAFKYTRRVEWQEIDGMQHVNNAEYLDYVSECAFHAIAASHWPWERMVKAGFGILLRRNQIQYLQPALLGDQLEITTWLSDARAVQALRHYRITRQAENGDEPTTIAWVHALGVCVELATGRPMRWPKEMLADFAPVIV